MRLRHLLVIGLALVSSAGPGGGVLAQAPTPGPSPGAARSLHYAFDAYLHGSAVLTRTARGWELEVREELFRPLAEARRWRNGVLLPGSHPLDERPAQLRALQVEPTGFTVVMDYPVAAYVETYHLTFEHLPAADPARCPVRLIRYRHEQRHLAGELRTGLVADFPRGVARLLALEGQPPATPLLPVRLLPRDTCLMELPSVFEGIPALDVPKYR